MQQPFFSICIPAYKNVNYIERLLASVEIQSCKDYEVIITDDSPDDSVKKLVEGWEGLRIRYYKNDIAAGTPANWNMAISKATGIWIKLMHDDDWFTSSESLNLYKKNIESSLGITFFYCAYSNIYIDSKRIEVKKSSFTDRYLLSRDPFYLLKKNSIGNPSCTVIHNSVKDVYNPRLKWIVDIEYYIRVLLKNKQYKYIGDVLVNVGINKDQVTHYTFRNPQVEIPENFMLLETYGHRILKKIVVFDYYWRMLRNLKIKSEDQLRQYYPAIRPGKVIQSMIGFQRNVNHRLLHNGFVSKACMLLTYFKNLF